TIIYTLSLHDALPIYYLPFPKFWIPMTQKVMQANPEALRLARQAPRHEQIDWGIKYSTPVNSVLLTHLNKQRGLANFLGDAAIYEHLQHNDAGALDHIEELLFQVRAIDHESFLINHLVAVGIQALTDARIELIAPGLTIDGSATPATAPASRPASRAQIKRIIAQFLDDQTQAQALQRTFRGEQMAEF